jgi:glycosyl transferase family 25
MLTAYLINLDRSPERLVHMEREFARIRAPFERVRAVDGVALGEAALAEFARTRTGVYPGRWLPGEVGCFLSHFAVWERIAAGEEEYAAIFEDDVHLAADLRPLLASPEWIPADADLVRLEANRKLQLRVGRRIAVATARRLHRVASWTWGSAGYVIGRDAAGRLVATAPEFHCWVDAFLFHPGRSPVASSLSRYQVDPAVCVQDQLLAGEPSGLTSVIGVDGRKPKVIKLTPSIRLKRLLPWKKRPVVFEP